MERCLKITCYTCGAVSYAGADQIDTQQDYFCPGCGQRMDRNQWRMQKVKFYTVENVIRQIAGAIFPVCEVRLFDAEYMAAEGKPVKVESVYKIENKPEQTVMNDNECF